MLPAASAESYDVCVLLPLADVELDAEPEPDAVPDVVVVVFLVDEDVEDPEDDAVPPLVDTAPVLRLNVSAALVEASSVVEVEAEAGG